MQPEIDYRKIGQRLKAARTKRGLSQAELAELAGCSNNHISHIETAQTKVSLPMLLRLSYILEENIDYFLLDTPFVKSETIINTEIADKLNKGNANTLIIVNKLLDALLEQQNLQDRQ